MSGKVRQSPFAIVPFEAALDHRLGAKHYRVLIAILSFRRANSDTVYPFRETLAERCGYTVNTVSRVTNDLARLGWLVKVGNGGRNRPAQYRVAMPETLSEPDTLSDPPESTPEEDAQVPDSSGDCGGLSTETLSESERVPEPDTLSLKRVSDPDQKGCPVRIGARNSRERKGEREGAREAGVIDAARVRKILVDRGFEHHRVIAGPGTRLITELHEQGVTEAEFREAIELAEAKQGGRPDSPAYYRWAINRVVGDRGATPQASTGGTAADKGAGNGLYDKDYAAGATGTEGAPGFLRGG